MGSSGAIVRLAINDRTGPIFDMMTWKDGRSTREVGATDHVGIEQKRDPNDGWISGIAST